jgi:hypothetical protein
MVSISTIESDISLGLGLLSSLGSKVDVVGIYSNGAGQGGASLASGITGLSSSILNSILGIPNAVASIGQVFVNARPLTASIRPSSKFMEHPGETGISLADHHVINPLEIYMPMSINSEFYSETYTQIYQAFVNATPFSIKTRVGVFSDMVIVDPPHEETPDKYDAIILTLHFKQVIYAVEGVNPSTGVAGGVLTNYQPLAADNSNTLASGLQQAAGLGTQLLAGAASISKYASVLKL